MVFEIIRYDEVLKALGTGYEIFRLKYDDKLDQYEVSQLTTRSIKTIKSFLTDDIKDKNATYIRISYKEEKENE